MPGYASRIGPSGDEDRDGDGLAVRVGFDVTGLVVVAVGDGGTTSGAAELTTGTGDWVNALGTAVP